MDLEVSSAVLAEMQREAKSAGPNECCGLLLGVSGAANRIDAIRPAANVHAEPGTHFEIDPQALVDAHRAARTGGPEVMGYYHSHPRGPAAPSATDRAQAAGDGRIWAIIGQDTLTFWRDEAGGFVPLSHA